MAADLPDALAQRGVGDDNLAPDRAVRRLALDHAIGVRGEVTEGLERLRTQRDLRPVVARETSVRLE